MHSLHTEYSSSEDISSSFGGDSTYDFIDDSSIDIADDESQDDLAESIALKDGQEYAALHVTDVTMSHLAPSDQQPLTEHQTPSSAFKNHTKNQHIHKKGEVSPKAFEPIRYSEPWSHDSTLSGFLEVIHPLGNVCETPAIPSKILTVRQTLCQRHICSDKENYKILYIGDFDAKDAIIHKIATALAVSRQPSESDHAHSRPSKFNIVPISSFGDLENPDVVLIDSNGVILEVEECRSAECSPVSRERRVLQIIFTNGTLIRSASEGFGYTLLDDWVLPDLAIIFVPENDDSGSQYECRVARKFMDRHRVPILTIASAPNIHSASASMDADHPLPHLCLEPQRKTLSGSNVVARVPIDLDTFLRIDPGQLNRTLACLPQVGYYREGRLSELPSQGRKWITKTNSYAKLGDWCPAFWQLSRDSCRQTAKARTVATLFLLILLSTLFKPVTIWLVSVFASRGSALKTPELSLQPILAMPIKMSVLESQSSTITVTSRADLTAPGANHVSDSLSTQTSLASLIFDHSAQANESKQFQAHVLGEDHIIMLPPQWLRNMRRSPRLSFGLSRRGKCIQYRLLRMFDDVYALHIPQEEAYGRLEVKVLTQSRPIVDESFEIDLGFAWLSAGAWKSATRTFGESMQEKLTHIHANVNARCAMAIRIVWTPLHKTISSILHRKAIDGANAMHNLRNIVKFKDLVVSHTIDVMGRLSSIIKSGAVATSKQWLPVGISIKRDPLQDSHDKATALLEDLKAWHKSLSALRFGISSRGVQGAESLYLREMQKTALKSWWKMVGTLGKENSPWFSRLSPGYKKA